MLNSCSHPALKSIEKLYSTKASIPGYFVSSCDCSKAEKCIQCTSFVSRPIFGSFVRYGVLWGAKWSGPEVPF